MKAQIVERVVKSLKNLIYKFLSQNNTKTYLPHLPLILDSYNKRRHAAHGFSPMEAELPENRSMVMAVLNEKFTEAVRRGRRRRKRAARMFRIGDIVRIPVDRKTFKRSYKPYFTKDLYEIIEIDRRQPVEMYRVKHARTGTVETHDYYSTELTLYNDAVVAPAADADNDEEYTDND